MKTYKKVFLVITILVILFIFVQSALPRSVSKEESGVVLKWLSDLLHRIFGEGMIGTLTDHIVRKAAHVIEYTVLGACLEVFFHEKKVFAGKWWLALVAGISTAFIDETIQIFSGRGPLISDVWIDFGGVCIGVVLVLAVLAIRNGIRRAR